MNNRSVLNGDIHFIGLPEILKLLNENSKTGTLSITHKHVSDPGRIYFMNGNPINADANDLRGLKAIYSLFGWTEGIFEFHEEKVNVTPAIECSLMEIILNGLRMMDEGLIKTVGSNGGGTEDGAHAQGKGKNTGDLKGPPIDYLYVIDEETIVDGEKIVKEGSHGNWIWLLLEGIAEVSVDTAKGPLPITRLGKGCFIGTLDYLLHGMNRRNASITAIGDVHIGLIDTQRLAGDFACLTNDFKTLLLSLDSRLKKMTYMAVKIHENGSDGIKSINGNRPVFEGEPPASTAFCITEGVCHVTARKKSRDIPLITLEKGDVFGSLPFMNIYPERPFAYLIGSNDLKIKKLQAASLKNEYDPIPRTLKNFIFNLSRHIETTTRLVVDLA